MRKGKGFLIGAGVLFLLTGMFCLSLIISSISNNINDDGSSNLAALFSLPIMYQLFALFIMSLVLGILLIVKSGNQKWGRIFLTIGVVMLFVVAIMVGIFLMYLFLIVLLLFIIPVLMIIGGRLNSKEAE